MKSHRKKTKRETSYYTRPNTHPAMTKKHLYLFTRTPMHVGAGTGLGAIDQPVVRERHTGFPVIPGSALKGCWADQYLQEPATGHRTDQGRVIFGHENPESDDASRGGVSFGEGRLLAFPVRSLKGCFAWVTSPLILQRWIRDTGGTVALPQAIPQGMDLHGHAGALAIVANRKSKVVLEDYAFDVKGGFEGAAALAQLMGSEQTGDNLWASLSPQHLCLISDDMMGYFARNACEIADHVKIEDDTGTASDGALFNQENVPAETLFYSVLTELKTGALANLALPNPPVFQIGGSATTGQGLCSARLEP